MLYKKPALTFLGPVTTSLIASQSYTDKTIISSFPLIILAVAGLANNRAPSARAENHG